MEYIRVKKMERQYRKDAGERTDGRFRMDRRCCTGVRLRETGSSGVSLGATSSGSGTLRKGSKLQHEKVRFVTAILYRSMYHREPSLTFVCILHVRCMCVLYTVVPYCSSNSVFLKLQNGYTKYNNTSTMILQPACWSYHAVISCLL